MPSIAAPLTVMAPTPHERDGRQPQPADGRPHPQQKLADEIGPRLPGAIYQNIDGRFEVLALVTDPASATQLLRRDAQWAVIVRDTLRADGEPFAVGSVWTNSDYLIRSGTSAYRTSAYRTAA